MSALDVPELWIVAGPNGAGKTTAVQKAPINGVLPGVTFLNPDDRTLLKLRAAGYQGFADAPPDVQRRFFFEAADEVSAELDVALGRAEKVGVETVLSSDKYDALVEKVLAASGIVGLIYVALSSPDLARERVAARVRRGGHGVPDDKIVQRWQRSLDRLAWFAARASVFMVYDNSDSDPAASPRLLASGAGGSIHFQAADVFPAMAQALGPLTRRDRAESSSDGTAGASSM